MVTHAETPNAAGATEGIGDFVVPTPTPGETHDGYLMRLASAFQEWGNARLEEIERRFASLISE